MSISALVEEDVVRFEIPKKGLQVNGHKDTTNGTNKNPHKETEGLTDA